MIRHKLLVKRMQIRRRNGENGIDAGGSPRFSAFRDGLWAAQDRTRSVAARAPRAAAELLRRPFEWLSWAVRHWLVWPVEDRAETLGAPARALGLAAVVTIAAGVGVAGLLWAAPDGRDGPAVAQTAAPVANPVDGVEVADEAKPAPTLHGAAPVFSPAGEGSSGVGKAEEIISSKPSSSPSSSSASSSSDASTSSSSSAAAPADSGATDSTAKDSPPDGPVAGPEAVGVARDFAQAFVAYEVGAGEDAAVREAFGETATPELSRALLRRPPRLPANVAVPKAKVLNVVPAPSHGRVYPISVALLRVGVTSELRLDMERLQGKRWRVTNVLG